MERIAATSNPSAGSALIARSSSLVSRATLKPKNRSQYYKIITDFSSFREFKPAYHSNFLFFVGNARQNGS
jgi:hypothetical protein